MNNYLKQFGDELNQLDKLIVVEAEPNACSASFEKLNAIIQDAENFIIANRGLPYWKENPLADAGPFGFPVPVQGKKNMAMYEGMMGSWIDKLINAFVCNDKLKAKKYVMQMLTMAKLMDHMAEDEEVGRQGKEGAILMNAHLQIDKKKD